MSNDPFSCFGDSSSSDDDDHDAPGDGEAAANLHEANRLKEQSNSERPIIYSIINDSFEVFDAGPLSGKGLRATSAYKCGDEIMRETAAMRIPNAQSASSLEAAEVMHKDAIQRAYNTMHHETQTAFMDLSSCNEDIATPQGIYDTNSFRLGNDPLGGLFLTLARTNHSCRPNVNHFWRENLQQTLVFATRDIEIGEELFTTYGPSECMDTRGRREYLNGRFSFQCTCTMCLEGNSNGGDDRMAKIQSLQEDIASSSSAGLLSTSAETSLDSVKKCLALMTEQGIGLGVFTKSIHHHGYDICVAAGDNEKARFYLLDELVAVQVSEGMDSPRAIAIEQVLNRNVPEQIA